MELIVHFFQPVIYWKAQILLDKVDKVLITGDYKL